LKARKTIEKIEAQHLIVERAAERAGSRRPLTRRTVGLRNATVDEPPMTVFAMDLMNS
jgi:hypothetical protein